MIPHIVFEALIKHYMYRTAPATFRFITCPLERRLEYPAVSVAVSGSLPAFTRCERRFRDFNGPFDHIARVARGNAAPTFALQGRIEAEVLCQFVFKLL